jgi:molybdate transport system substrate-binding protein
LRVFAAGSLRPAFDRLAAASPQPVALTYANARDLAERISDGVPADVFASASAEHPRLLHGAGLVTTPRPFATNRLVVAVPSACRTQTADVLAASGARVVIEVAGIPLGDYTRLMLLRMDEVAGAGFSALAMTNVVAEEQVVDAVAARLLAGDADAGVLYATDVAARAPRLRAIELPAGARVAVTLSRARRGRPPTRRAPQPGCRSSSRPRPRRSCATRATGPRPAISRRRRSSPRARRRAPS